RSPPGAKLFSGSPTAAAGKVDAPGATSRDAAAGKADGPRGAGAARADVLPAPGGGTAALKTDFAAGGQVIVFAALGGGIPVAKAAPAPSEPESADLGEDMADLVKAF